MTENITVNFTPPDGKGGASVTYWQNGKIWTPSPVERGQTQSYCLTQGDANGWTLWGISFWGVGNNPGGNTRILRTNVAKMVAVQGQTESAFFYVGGEQYEYVKDICKGFNSNWCFNFTVQNDNKNASEDQIGWVCFEVIFTDSHWDHYFVSRDPEIPLQKKLDPIGR